MAEYLVHSRFLFCSFLALYSRDMWIFPHI